MKVLILDLGGTAVDFAMRCQWAGHEVKLYLGVRKHLNIGKGLVTRVSDWKAHMKWADLILMTDINKYVDDLEWYFENKYPILGTNKGSMQLELIRDFGQSIMDSCGLLTIPFQKFDDCDTAIKYVMKRQDSRFVSKPCGDGGTSMSYVSKSAADMVYMLQRWKKANALKQPFIIQDFIGGIEMGIGGWFGPHGFNEAIEENFEHKKLMNGNIGVNTGEMGTAMKYTYESSLFDATLKKCENALQALNFRGNVDINIMIDKDGNLWPMEWTMRLGWPAFYLQNSLHRGDPVEWMLDLLEGRDSLKVRPDHCIGVVMTIPDFPYSHLTGKEVEGVPIYGINNENIKDIHLAEVMAGSAPCMDGDKVVEKELFVAAGDYLLTVVGRGASVEQAREKAYKTVKEIEIPNSPMYRTDIGKRLEDELPKLQKVGFATDWKY